MAKRTSRKAKRHSRKRTSRRNGYGRSYGGDPRWMSARFDGIDDEGNKVRKGDEVLYWPSTKRVQTGEKAKAAWRRFLSEKGDDEGTPYASNPRRRSRRNGKGTLGSRWSLKAKHTAIHDIIDHTGTFLWTPRAMVTAVVMEYGPRMTLADARSALKSFAALGGTHNAALVALGGDRFQATRATHAKRNSRRKRRSR